MKFSNIQPSLARLDFRPALLHVLSFIGLCSSLLGANLQGLNDNFKALALAGSDILAVTADDAVARSTDGGLSFSELRAADDALQTIAIDGTIAIVGGDSGWLVRADLTADPASWSDVASGASFGGITGIASDGANTWLAVTDNPGDVLRSTDNGLTWSLIANAPAYALNAITFDSLAGHWIAVGGDFFDGHAFYSADGMSWQAASGLSGGPLLSLSVDSAGTVMAVGEGVILKSVDGGVTYAEVSGAPTGELRSVVAVAVDQYIAVGFDGLIVEIGASAVTILQNSAAQVLTIDAVIAADGAAFVSGQASVTAPAINPNGGAFAAPVTVTLAVPSATQVYYTIDGSAPSDQSTLYTAPFVLDDSATVRAIARQGEFSSVVESADFVVSTLPDTKPLLEISRIDPTSFLIELPESQAALNYQLQRSIDLVTWDPLQSPRVGSGAALTWTVPVDGTRRFYQVLISD